MYLTTNQHDRLRTIVIGFEIPFRSYVASTIISNFQTLGDFQNEIIKKKATLPASAAHSIKSKCGIMAASPQNIYSLLETSNTSYKAGRVDGVVDLPNVSDLVAITLIFSELFRDLICSFPDDDTYSINAEQYHYIRNKLSHPGSKIIEDNEMNITINFISGVCEFIGGINEGFFWDKSRDSIEKEIVALQTLDICIPVPKHNINDMPFPDMRIVCRDQEIAKLKEFAYGLPGAIRKKSSFCVMGYGGLGKTALVLETIKHIIKDIQDGNTINGYKPDFILFFSAKEERLDISYTSGKIHNTDIKSSFNSYDTLKNNIFSELGIESFNGFHGKGIIIVDNLESLSNEERLKVKEFIQFMSPSDVQYIITSRNEEEYEGKLIIKGFEKESGMQFIETYIAENDLNVELSEVEIEQLLELSRGNTLVLVLSLRRLSKKLATVDGIMSDFSRGATAAKMTQELKNLPLNGYEIISEYMFKNTFIELESIYDQNKDMLFSILKVLAVYPEEQVDIYTICILLKTDYLKIEPIITILCRYLIVEKKGDSYSLNRFAEKYIIQRFLPDSTTYLQMSTDIESSTRAIKKELALLQNDIQRDPRIRRILDDWCIVNDGDKIAAAKAFRLYEDVNRECGRGARFFVNTALDNALQKLVSIEVTTMHPYVKYQKARILQKVDDSNILLEKHNEEIIDSYCSTIWIIKTNPYYSRIRYTKSYASVLWIFGTRLLDSNIIEAIRYLEEGCNVFEQLGILDNEYYKCLSSLGHAYLIKYKEDKQHNVEYLRKSRKVSNQLFDAKDRYHEDKKTRHFATSLREELQQYGRF